MLLRVPHDATLPYLTLSDFELGFDKGDNCSIASDQTNCIRQDLVKRDKRGIYDRNIRRFRQLFRFQITDVGLFQTEHPRILSQLPGKLPVAHINCKYPSGPPLQQTVRKPAGRCLVVKGATTVNIYRKKIK